MLPRESGPDKNNPADADIVFEALPDRPRPRLPRPIDGEKFLSADQASQRYGIRRDLLVAEWCSTFEALDLSRGESPAPAPRRRRPRVRLPRELLDQVDALAARIGFPRSELLRFWIGQGLARAGRGNG